MNPLLPYSLVVATMERPSALAEFFTSVASQSHRPAAIIVVDASADRRTADLCERWQGQLPIRRCVAHVRSAAAQRNQGAELITTPLIGFADDDIVLPPDTLEKLAAPFARAEVGGVAGRIVGLTHPVPSRLLWWYYRLQAGYSHPHYGGKVIGPAINLLPAFDATDEILIRSDWLNSTLVLYRRELFEREHFPRFEGYSFLEDAHLSLRIGRTHELFFRSDAPYVHNSQPSSAKADRQALARMIVRHQRIVAQDILRLRGLALEWKLAWHRLFQSVAVLREGAPGRWRAVRGFW